MKRKIAAWLVYKFTCNTCSTCGKQYLHCLSQECEKHITQLQSQMSSLQQDKAVSDAAIQRKDQLLLQAQQQWKLIETEWNAKLSSAEEQKSNFTAVFSHSNRPKNTPLIPGLQ